MSPASPSFTVIDGDHSSPCILHVPHASVCIPEKVRRDIVLDDRALKLELDTMTDAYTDLIAGGVADLGTGPRPWSFVNGLSRLVIDPSVSPTSGR